MISVFTAILILIPTVLLSYLIGRVEGTHTAIEDSIGTRFGMLRAIEALQESKVTSPLLVLGMKNAILILKRLYLEEKKKSKEF